MEKYEELLKQNELLFSVVLVKEKLTAAYRMDIESDMSRLVIEIIDLCRSAGNPHFKRLANLIGNHFEGIIAHATYQTTSGKVEGIHIKIWSLRRQGYGYPDIPSHEILE